MQEKKNINLKLSNVFWKTRAAIYGDKTNSCNICLLQSILLINIIHAVLGFKKPILENFKRMDFSFKIQETNF